MALCPGPSTGTRAGPVVRNLILGATIDGDFLPDVPENLFHNAANFGYISGVNDMDGHFFAGLDVPSINSMVQTSSEDLKRLLGDFTKEKGLEGKDRAISTYTSTWGTQVSQETIKKTVVDVETDFIFLIPIQVALYLHANA
ncbi:hypothetical protein CRUP_019013, partial [Coryphaenoides rupestris]